MARSSGPSGELARTRPGGGRLGASVQSARSQGSAGASVDGRGVDTCDVRTRFGSVQCDSSHGSRTPPRATSLAPAMTPPHLARRLAGVERRESAGRVWIHDTMWVSSSDAGSGADKFAYSPTHASKSPVPRVARLPAHKRFLQTASGVLRFRSASCSAVPPARDVVRSAYKKSKSSAVTPTSGIGGAPDSPTRLVEMQLRYGGDAASASQRGSPVPSSSAARSRGRASAVSSASTALSIATGRDGDAAGAGEGVSSTGGRAHCGADMPTPLESVGSTGSEGSHSFFSDDADSSDEELEEAAAGSHDAQRIGGSSDTVTSEAKDSTDDRFKPTISVAHARNQRAGYRRRGEAPPGSNSPVCTWEALLHDDVPQSPFGWFAAETTHVTRRSSTRPRTLSVNSHHDDDWAHPTLGHPVMPTPGKSPEGAPPPSALSPVRG